jgi:hypothetical protein
MYDSSKQGEMVFRFKPKEPETGVAITHPKTTITLNKLDTGLCNKVENFLLARYNHIMELDPFSDETTSLSSESISTRWNKYNIFSLDNSEEMDVLLEYIRRYYRTYCYLHGMSPEPVMLSAWFNLLESGQQISEHNHGDGSLSYLSGNIFISGVDKSSSTVYYVPTENTILTVKNTVGDITLFPSWLNHQTTRYEGDSPRLTIGLNFIPVRFEDEYIKAKNERGTHDFLDHVVYI